MRDETHKQRAQRCNTEILNLIPHGQAKELAQQMGVSESSLSEARKHLETNLLLIHHLGLQVVPASAVLVDRRAKEFMAGVHERVTAHAPHLLWGDVE